ncbi:hypothetical protein LWM68_08575 [Niabella sp. W65]|nr:hypothetical protein [Niabella sp. W65]MCH7362818.1 hypothetical protein [Niabella sp. W65]
MKRNQEIGFESINESKFIPLSKQKMNLVLGGRSTPGGTKVLMTEYKIVDGVRYQQQKLKSWSSDDFSDAGECYTGLEYCTTDWVPS